MIDGRKYTEFGSYMLGVANKNKGVRGPYRVARFMEQEAGRKHYDLGWMAPPASRSSYPEVVRSLGISSAGPTRSRGGSRRLRNSST